MMQDPASQSPEPGGRKTAAATPRNLVICSDGTGNRGGITRGTNVWRLYQAVDLTSREPEQLVLYDDGVGTEDFKLFKLLGGATGFGLSANIREMYEWLMLNYRPPGDGYPGDRIFLFGFSRGAYTVRSLAGMLHHCGLLLGGDLEASKVRAVVKEVYGRYYRGSLLGRLLGRKSSFRRPLDPEGGLYQPPGWEEGLRVARPGVHLLGVWDTVGAVGVPGWMQRAILLARSARFHDVNANNWTHAYQALAVDDERLSFWPELLPAEVPGNGGRVEQVWFAGAHSNVGGGYPKDGLAFVALEWMMTHAAARGLVFTGEAWAEVCHRANPHDRIYDPRAGLRAYFRYKPRELAKIRSGYEKRHGAAAPSNRVHLSVIERIDKATGAYAPAYLPEGLEVVATVNGAVHRAGQRAVQAQRSAQGDMERSKALTRILAETDEERLAAMKAIVPKTWVRKTLYWVLITATVALLGFGVYLIGVVPEAAQRQRELPAWLASALGWLGARVVELVPSFLRRIVAGLFDQAVEHPWLSLTLLVLAVLAFVLRQWLKKSAGRHALAGWHSFRTRKRAEEPSGPQSPNPGL